ncbi:ABC transporter permease [Streptomyces sp. NPDC056835]|uniref:ABC transporter permease n=1 Tax=Streptomyces sp. NPDC056835 TaxID=3345956 RepID=UPI0036B4CDF8
MIPATLTRLFTDTHVSTDRTGWKVTGRRVLRSEWSKFWSLRSSWITLAVSVAVLIAFGVIAAALYRPTAVGPGDATAIDAVSLALTGTSMAGLIVGVLGVLMSAGEYGTGMVRSTYAAVPRRALVLASKSAVIGSLVLVLATIGALVAFGLGTVGLHGERIALALSDDGVLRSLAGAGVYLALFAMLGVALGSLVRSTSGSIAALVGIVMLLPGLAAVLPGDLQDSLDPYFPGNAGAAVYSLHTASGSLSPGAGFVVFAGWVALALAAAAIRLKRTDV